MNRVIKFRAWGPNCKAMWNWSQVKEIANKLGWENFDQGERILMQFTGLTDVNGAEIYEGDIVRFNLRAYGNWQTEKFGEIGAVKMDHNGASFGSWMISYCTDSKVIGNIYENPELLVT